MDLAMVKCMKFLEQPAVWSPVGNIEIMATAEVDPVGFCDSCAKAACHEMS